MIVYICSTWEKNRENTRT